jgi:hypothetical protein
MDQKIKDKIAEQYGPIKLNRGRWFIIADALDKGAPHELWHLCDPRFKEDLDFATYQTCSWYDDRPITPNWRCSCNKIPPDSIVAVWCLLEPDHTSECIQEALKFNIEDELQDAADEYAMAIWGPMEEESWDYMHDIGDLLGS